MEETIRTGDQTVAVAERGAGSRYDGQSASTHGGPAPERITLCLGKDTMPEVRIDETRILWAEVRWGTKDGDRRRCFPYAVDDAA